MTHDLAIINTFVLYIGFMMAIGVYYYRRTRNMSDYFLGNRKLGAWVTSLSAEASDMSGWMLMGVPGYAYLAGLNAGWIAIGIAIGTWANWHFVAAHLRKYTELANNSLTLPEFLQNRFHDKSGLLRIVPAIFILIFFVIYTSSGFVSAGRLFETVFGIPYEYAIFIGAGSVVFYTLVGGFLAVSRTDFIQGVMMFFAILVVPICAAMQCGGFESTVTAIQHVQSTMLEPLTKPDGSTMNAIELISLLAWGIGYFGQPHILVRFMAIRTSKEVKQATHIAMTWVVISLAAAVLVGRRGLCLRTGLLPHAAAQGRRAEGARLDLSRERPRHREPRDFPWAQPEQLHPRHGVLRLGRLRRRLRPGSPDEPLLAPHDKVRRARRHHRRRCHRPRLEAVRTLRSLRDRAGLPVLHDRHLGRQLA